MIMLMITSFEVLQLRVPNVRPELAKIRTEKFVGVNPKKRVVGHF